MFLPSPETALSFLSATLPATERGLSSHVFKMAPPYTSTLILPYPFVLISGEGLIYRHGWSVWAAAMRSMPLSKFFPILNAKTEESNTFIKYPFPLSIIQSSLSLSSAKPACSSLLIASSAAVNAHVEALTAAISLSADLSKSYSMLSS